MRLRGIQAGWHFPSRRRSHTSASRMNAGRELDALVAEKVFGWTGGHYESLPFSTDIAAAWEVVERLRSRGISSGHGFNWDLCIKVGHSDDSGWFVELFDLSSMGYCGPADTTIRWDGVDVRNAETASHAICLAALKAVGVEAA